MAGGIATVGFACQGGLITSVDLLKQGAEMPGSAATLVNFESAQQGGYNRVLGYAKFDPATVPGTGDILGVMVFRDKVLAARGAAVYASSGSGWTSISGADVRTGAGYYHFDRYAFMGSAKIVFTDGVNRPATYSAAGTYTVLSTAPLAATCVADFKSRLWFGAGTLLTASAPVSDTDYTPGGGAFVINTSDEITALRSFRDILIVFCRNKIYKLSGSSSTNFVLEPITTNLGCALGDTVQEVAGDLYFLAPDGIRSVAATERIGDFNLSPVSLAIQPTISAFTASRNRVFSTALTAKSQYRLLSKEASLSSTAEGFIGTRRGDAWEFSILKGFTGTAADSSLNLLGVEVSVLAGASGYVYQMESGNSLDGAALTYTYQTPYLTFDDPNIRKVFRRLRLFLRAEGNYDLTLRLLLNYTDSSTLGTLQPEEILLARTSAGLFRYNQPGSTYGTAIYSGSPPPISETLLVGAGLSGALRFTGSTTNDPPFTISSIALELSQGGRR